MPSNLALVLVLVFIFAHPILSSYGQEALSILLILRFQSVTHVLTQNLIRDDKVPKICSRSHRLLHSGH